MIMEANNEFQFLEGNNILANLSLLNKACYKCRYEVRKLNMSLKKLKMLN